eukprot:m.397802 g.397802  ORF g.397802 m.397802 type:complete len:83 (-) comp56424_c0_seq4:562-810(-)
MHLASKETSGLASRPKKMEQTDSSGIATLELPTYLQRTEAAECLTCVRFGAGNHAEPAVNVLAAEDVVDCRGSIHCSHPPKQ